MVIKEKISNSVFVQIVDVFLEVLEATGWMYFRAHLINLLFYTTLGDG